MAAAVEHESADRRRRTRGRISQPRNADQQEHAAPVAQTRRHRQPRREKQRRNDGAGDRRAIRQHEPSDDARAQGRPQEHDRISDPHRRRDGPRRQKHDDDGRWHEPHPRSHEQIQRGRPAHCRRDRRPELLAIPRRNERPAIAGQHAVHEHRVDARRKRDRSVDRVSVDRNRCGHIRSGLDVQDARRTRVEKTLNGHRHARTGRTIGGDRPALVVRRQVEEPRGKLAQFVIRPRHDGRARRVGRSPVGAEVPRVRSAARILEIGTRRDESHAPAVLHEDRGRARLPDDQQHDCRSRDSRGQKSWMQPPQDWKDDGGRDRFGDAIERHAVERSTDAIGPEQRRGCKQAPDGRHTRAIVVQPPR